MAKPFKNLRSRMTKANQELAAQKARDLFAELSEGVTALAEARAGKRKLRSRRIKRPSS